MTPLQTWITLPALLAAIEAALTAHPRIALRREEVRELPRPPAPVRVTRARRRLAHDTGPLTQPGMWLASEPLGGGEK